ncbi:MAG: agmatine deiminase family protein [Bacteroidales bacterium]|nr:agmatine deiminase family protein [Bacteroidales bacterium]
MLASVLTAFGAMAQSQQMSDEELLRNFRQTVQKRDIAKRHLESNIPLSSMAPATKGNNAKSLPEDRVWFPGEWEEVQAICVTPYYIYRVPGYETNGSWMADPLVSGYAEYLQYSVSGWQQRGMGPYISVMDTVSTFGKVFFYLMDGIQLGGAEAWVRVEKPEDSAKVIRTLTRMNLRHDNVRFIVGKGNSFWYRDCGPIAFYYGDQDSLGMLDFTYYPGRALDDSLPSLIHWQMGIPNYLTPIEWEGGNCLVDGAGMVFSSDAIYSNNADRYGQLTWDGQDPNSINYSQATPLTQAQVRQGLHDLLGQRATYVLPAYQYDGGTGHVDLYADAYDENGFVFSVMPSNYSNWTDYRTGARNIDSLCSYKSIFDRDYYTMATLPFPSTDNGGNFSSQTQYNNQYTRTYSNHTFVNNVILQPCFSSVVNGQPSADWDRANIEAVAAAYPGYTIYPVDVREFDGSGGAIHCVTKQIPAENPIRILHKNLHGTFAIGEMTQIPVSAIITNKSGIASAVVYWREEGSEEWNTLELSANGNRFNGLMPRIESAMPQHSVEYYISATSNNGKTITKPMTASQGGYYTFTYTDGESVDSTMFDFDTLPMPMEDITFAFGSSWVEQDGDEPRPLAGIEEAEMEENFGQFYPNPATDEAHMAINLGNGESYTVSIIDQSGRTIHTSSLMAAGHIEYTINAGRLASGVYNVVFSNKDARVVRRLIVK